MSFFFFINWGRKKLLRDNKQIPDPIKKILFLPGCTEITLRRNDIVALDLTSQINRKSSLQGIINQVNRQGGLAILAHPSYFLKRYNRRKLFRLKDYLGIEIYNPNKIPWPETTKRWDFILTRRPYTRIWGFATDDMHDLKRDAGRAWIMVRAKSFDSQSILEALRQGSFYSTTGPIIDKILLNEDKIKIILNKDYQVKFIGYNRKTLEVRFGREVSYPIRPQDIYVRAEIKDLRYRKKAWTQPFFIRDGKFSYAAYLKEGGWLRGSIHVHTDLKGGRHREEEVVEWYRNQGYDFLAITEHNIIAHPKISPSNNG
jgi:hypothetical protein